MKTQHNDNERREWVRNHQPLYGVWLSSGVGLYRFVRENRAYIDQVREDELTKARRAAERVAASRRWGP